MQREVGSRRGHQDGKMPVKSEGNGDEQMEWAGAI